MSRGECSELSGCLYIVLSFKSKSNSVDRGFKNEKKNNEKVS